MWYYLFDSTCLNQKQNYPNSIINNENTKDFKKIAYQILPLFNNKIPDTESVRQCISCFNKLEIIKAKIGYLYEYSEQYKEKI